MNKLEMIVICICYVLVVLTSFDMLTYFFSSKPPVVKRRKPRFAVHAGYVTPLNEYPREDGNYERPKEADESY